MTGEIRKPETPETRGPEARKSWLEVAMENIESLESLENRLVDGKVLRNWIRERTLLSPGSSATDRFKERWTTEVGMECGARAEIARAIKADIAERRWPTIRINPIIDRPALVIAGEAWSKAIHAMNSEGRDNLSVVSTDQVTGEKITREIYSERGSYMGHVLGARITKEDGTVVDARLGSTSLLSTELTLNYDSEYYLEKEANPAINKDRGLPRATATTYRLLTEAILEDIQNSRREKVS